ncbi:patatin-like phospholipase family protein [Paenibacillus athensensis]|uniref:patatin-like phospholipase family protein n=1 Tax=Paenibacillus athensensis TaxID=1967502 RepID=UPI00142F93B7|nr:patatin-like phospholipase family protein [Paenibacillus athensensis]MCD1261759.1 patatin-like phospholipase family protein [Paenibacillus athensensis]
MIGLALSGGGYRASLFHLGVLARLADEGLLKEVGAISTVSGGSIVGAFYYQKLCKLLQREAPLDDNDYRRLVREVIAEFLPFVQKDVRDRVLYRGVVARIIPAQLIRMLLKRGLARRLNIALESQLELVMNKLLFASGTFSELLEPPAHPANRKPELILNTSILENGQQLFFSTDVASPLWRHNERKHGVTSVDAAAMPIARMAAASACVPGLFTPIALSFGDGEAVHGVDGGVLDNLGGHALQLLGQSEMKLLLSDASKPISTESYAQVNGAESFFRIQDLFMDAIRELRLASGVETLVGMRDDIPGIDAVARQLTAGLRTDLNAFSEVEAYSLMYAGYCACNRQIAELHQPAPAAGADSGAAAGAGTAGADTGAGAAAGNATDTGVSAGAAAAARTEAAVGAAAGASTGTGTSTTAGSGASTPAAAPAPDADDWEFGQIRPYMQQPTAEYLSLMGSKSKPTPTAGGFSFSAAISLLYLLLYIALFVYISVERGVLQALLYLGVIPLAVAAVAGVILLLRLARRGNGKGSMAELRGHNAA